jgi:acetyl-CoA carboxylase biotin carboxylase subunit
MPRTNKIKKILIANRGEIAIRILRACREMGIKTVAVYSDVDAGSLPVRLADQACHIGPSPASESYLNIGRIIEAAIKTGADALHPGYGFLSENPDFARECIARDIIFIGPDPNVILSMGEKTVAKQLIQKAGIPTIPGVDRAIIDLDEARTVAVEIGYPLILKAAKGGGGRGMRIVRNDLELSGAFRLAKSEALAAFGSDAVFMEKYIVNPRHIEFQILADKHGNVVHLGERDCTLQRRHQ